ncbi:TPA: VWA domain-containing protein [Pseudomonas putida]|nr:VWA domain-containing protein [Pseudomonas putida]
MGGEKIQNLNEAVSDMLDVFRGNETSETEIWVSIITFGSKVTLHQPLASANDIEWRALKAGGTTPLGVALEMAKAMIEDKDVVPSRAYRPAVVLVSDGQPDNGWKGALREFVNEGRSAKCDRMAMAIGADADESVLGAFIEGAHNPLFYAENARQLRDFFKFVTMSVTIRTKSQTPNTIPPSNSIDVQPATIGARRELSVPTAPDAEDGGYW